MQIYTALGRALWLLLTASLGLGAPFLSGATDWAVHDSSIVVVLVDRGL